MKSVRWMGKSLCLERFLEQLSFSLEQNSEGVWKMREVIITKWHI